MRISTSLLLAALCAPAAFPPIARGQDDGAAFVRCTKCKNRGWQPAEAFRKEQYELEANVDYCSLVAGDEQSGGIGWVDCEHCANPDVELALRKKRERIPLLREGLKNLDEEMKRPLRYAATRHFVVVVEVDGMKVGKKRYDAHRLLHLYIDRLERLYTDYTQILGVSDGEFKKPSRVMLWDFQPDHEEASGRFCNSSGQHGVKLLGATPTYSVPATKQHFKDDETLHRNVIHNATHLLLSHQTPSRWIGQIKGGWADAGLAHWFEARYFEICDNYCYQEVNTRTNFKGGKWKPAVRKLVAADKAPRIPKLFQENTDTLTPAEHAASYSLIDYLIHVDPAKLNQVLRNLRTKMSSRDAIQEMYGWNPLQLEERWKAWVLDTYPAR